MSLLSCYDSDPSSALRCPQCKKGWSPEWSTEYRDPVICDTMVYFPCCDKSFRIFVDVVVTYSPIVNEDSN